MNWLLPPLEPHFDAALRDVTARTPAARLAAATRLERPEPGREGEAEMGLIALLDDPMPQVRAAALRSLSEVGSHRAHEAARACLDDGDPLVRELSVVALASIDHPERRPALLNALEHAAPEVRFQALCAIAELCPDAALEHVLVRSGDPDERVREAATRALGQLAPTGNHVTGKDGRIATRLRALLNDASARVRFEAALATPGAPEALGPLLHALEIPALRFDALDGLSHHTDARAVEAVYALGRRVLAPPILNAMAGRTLIAMGRRDLAVACLRDALRAYRADGRNLAVETIRQSALHELAPEVERLSRRPRGADPERIVEACAALASAPDATPDQIRAARRALATLARRADAAGALAKTQQGNLEEPP